MGTVLYVVYGGVLWVVLTAGGGRSSRLCSSRRCKEVGLAPAVLAVYFAEFSMRPHRHQHLPCVNNTIYELFHTLLDYF